MKRMKTGIPGLDEMLDGGLIEGTSTLLKGPAGIGKTTLGLQFIYKGIVEHNEPGLIVSFEHLPAKIYRDAESFGWNLRKLEENGKLRTILTSPQIFHQELMITGGMLDRLTCEMNLKRFLIDNISYFEVGYAQPVNLRGVYNTLIGGLERNGLTSILISESSHISTDYVVYDHGLSYLTDCVVLLRFVEIEGEMEKAILILKMRATSHDTKIRRLEISEKGMTIKSDFKGYEQMLTGIPRRFARVRGKII
ncbi:MAG: ATPase domain-containing protein [Candidatus Edwardsbacteria bacterium]